MAEEKGKAETSLHTNTKETTTANTANPDCPHRTEHLHLVRKRRVKWQSHYLLYPNPSPTLAHKQEEEEQSREGIST